MALFPSRDRFATPRRNLDIWSSRWLACGLLLFCLSACLRTVTQQIAMFDWVGEAGYVDNYILHTALEFQKTGVIYPSPGTSKSFPSISLYSPMLYRLLALPGRLVSWENAFLGPRIIEIAAFMLCVAVTASISHALFPHPWAWLWGMLLALSIDSMRDWVLQLRGDFPGILFSLISIRLLLARSRWYVLLAGAAAGFATQFKFTLVSATLAGVLWLAIQRRWKSAAEFTGAATVTSLGIYLLFWHREPQMVEQIFTIRHPIREYREFFGWIGHTVLSEPVLLLGAATLPLFALRRWSRWRLLIGYLAISLVISAVLEVQAGANVNYFFEALFALVPLAVFGAFQLGRCRSGTAGLFLSGLLVIYLAVPNYVSAYRTVVKGRKKTASWNLSMVAAHKVFQGQHVLSMVPTATYLAPETVVSEPYLVSYLDRLGQVDLQPLIKRIVNREFDLVITETEAISWRGVPRMPTRLRPAIEEAYQPFCVFEGSWLIQLPRRSPTPGLAERLRGIGCIPAIPDGNYHPW